MKNILLTIAVPTYNMFWFIKIQIEHFGTQQLGMRNK